MPRPRLGKPKGYDDGGKVLAEAVLKAEQSKSWAKDLAKLLGYSTRDLEAWLRWYRHENYAAVRSLEKTRKKRLEKAEALAAKLKKIREFKPPSPNAPPVDN